LAPIHPPSGRLIRSFKPLLEFPAVLIYPLVEDPYASLTPAELATFGIGPARAPDDDNDDDNDDEEKVANGVKEMEDDE
jgi:hypothetical protein